MILKMAFVNNGPVPVGVCKRCAGDREIQQQNMGGEVRFVECSRCQGSGIEPKTRWEKFKAAFRAEPIEV